MTFILKIFFMGLIAFVPSQDGKELTVLLVETRPGYVASDGSLIAPHHPMLLARAEKCWGHCGIDEGIDPHLLFPRDSPADAQRYLAAALGNGAAWSLDGSDLSIVDAGSQKSSASLSLQGRPRQPGAPLALSKTLEGDTLDFDYIADLGRVLPAAGAVDPDVLARLPQRRLITARLRLQSGKIGTYRLVHMFGKVHSFSFKALRCNGANVEYSQPLADWVTAEIEVSGPEVEIVENHFADREIRTIRLAPQDGLVELAVLNIPDPPSEEELPENHEADRHFELYYKLAQTLLSPCQWPVPHVGPEVENGAPEKARPSALLAGLKLGDPKGYYERIMCPVGQLSESGAP
ncbi:MAG TPA: hypothetical protein VF756_22765 [Thermoanaerobaculia bacterium]